jgi:superfamily II DNA or RNA helicase
MRSALVHLTQRAKGMRPVSDLLKHLHKLEPSAIWSLAPRDTLMQGSGLMATGEPETWYVQNEVLTSRFPLRLSTLDCHTWLQEGRLVSQCSCGKTQPCAHAVATLMLVIHLLKESNVFGRYPNKNMAVDLLRVLSMGDYPTATTKSAPAAAPLLNLQKHILIKPGGPRLFTYHHQRGPTNRFQQQFQEYAPHDVTLFTSAWTHSQFEEDGFWRWFTTPAKRFPVLIELPSGLVKVSGPGTADYTGTLSLDADGHNITMQRKLFLHGEEVPGPWHEVGLGLVFLESSAALVRVPFDSSWYELEKIKDRIGKRAIHALDSPEPPSGMRYQVSREDWNQGEIEIQQQANPYRLSTSGQACEIAAASAPLPIIDLVPDSDGSAFMDVHLSVEQDGLPLPAMGRLLPIERMLSEISADAILTRSGQRITEMMSALCKCWLAPTTKEQKQIIALQVKSPAFKDAHQRRSAARLLHGINTQVSRASREPDTTQVLQVSADGRWVGTSGGLAETALVIALAYEHLGASLALPWRDYFPEHFFKGKLSVSSAIASSRLTELMTACEHHGVRLTYLSKPIARADLTLEVQALSSGSLDYFELKTEVRSSDKLIPQEEWENIVRTGTFTDPDGTLQVIELKSLDALRRVHRVLKHQQKESTGNKTELKVPRLRILDWLAMRQHGVKCQIPASEAAILESLLTFETLQRIPLPEVHATLRDYQHEGYSWLAFLYQHRFGACLADDMGLGKTLQTICLLAAIKHGTVKPLDSTSDERLPHLLIVPPTLLFNWQAEVQRFCPDLYVHPYTGTSRSLIGIKEGIVLTTYETARRDIDTLKDHSFDCIIFDEAQAVKNFTGERAQAMRQLKGRFKLCLTGTPLENHAGEYFSIIDLALPGLLGERKSFLESLREAPENRFEVLDRARPFVLRRTKSEILKELPPKVETDIQLELSAEQKRYYTRAVGEVKAEVLAAFKDKTAQQAGIVALAALTRLRQICVSPALLNANYTERSPKLSYLCDQLEELQTEGHAALVFSQFTRALDELEKHLKQANIAFQRLDGSTPNDKRRKLVEAYQKGTAPGVFLISLRAGGAGLNLTRASYVFHLDPWWNPAVENQASDRAHRMGQTNKVFIQRLVMLHTVEEKIMELKVRKRALFDQVMQGTATSTPDNNSLITKDDLRFLLD